MKTKSRVLEDHEEHPILDSPLLWSTIALYSIAAIMFFWSDFAKIIAWVAA